MRRFRGYRDRRFGAVIAITKKRFSDSPPVWEFRAESTASIAFRYSRVSAAELLWAESDRGTN
jgi:hypothetical protein